MDNVFDAFFDGTVAGFKVNVFIWFAAALFDNAAGLIVPAEVADGDEIEVDFFEKKTRLRI